MIVGAIGELHNRQYVCIYVCMCVYVCMVITHRNSEDQPGMVADSARGQLNSENDFFPVPVRA